MKATLVRGRTIVRGVDSDGNVVQMDDAAVLVRDGTIVEVGPVRDLQAHDGAEVIGGDDFVILPGFVNAHHHVGLTPLQLGAPDLPLELWANYRMGARRIDLYLDTLYSAFELVRSGVTAVQHLHSRVSGGVDEVAAGAREVIRAYRDLGMRVSYAYALRDQNRVVYADDETFYARLPDDIAGPLRATVNAQALSAEENLEVFRVLSGEFAEAGDVAIQLAPLNFQWCSDSALERVAALSHERGTLVHLHLLETPYQRAYARKRTGGSALGHLDRLGLLNERMTLGHGVWTTADDLDLVAERGTSICHNCSSNLRLQSGWAPVNAMLERGIRVALGIDEAGMNDDRDMLQEMRQVLRTHRVPGHQARVPSVAEVLRMATENGAGTTGFGTSIGRLDPGRAADMVLMRWSRIARPFLDPDVGVLDAVVQRGKTNAVDTVLIGGVPVLRGGRFTRIDEEAALRDLAQFMSRPADEDERQRRVMVRRLMPHVEAFYQDWLAEEPFEPYDVRNSRT